MLRIPVSESYYKMKSQLEVQSFCAHSPQNGDPSNFQLNLSKMHFIWPVLQNFIFNIYFFLSRCVIHAKGNKPVTTLGYKNVSFTIKAPLKMLICHVWYSNYSNKTSISSKTTDFQSSSKVLSSEKNFVDWQPLTAKQQLCK